MEWVDDENADKLNVGNKGEYKVEAILESAVYEKESESGHYQASIIWYLGKGI